MSEKEWEKTNARRLELIDKKYSVGLSRDERRELTDMQVTASEYMNEKHPLSFDELEKLEEYERKTQHMRKQNAANHD